MTDLEISKALALAIGWSNAILTRDDAPRVVVYTGKDHDRVKSSGGWFNGYRVFDYRDWNVIGPIAERYACFPTLVGYGLWSSRIRDGKIYDQDTPQKAIALAVIGANK